MRPDANDPAARRAVDDPVAHLSERYRRLVETAVTENRRTDPSVSVVVVTYRTDREAFESVLSALESQTEGAFELVVVDNGVEWGVESRLRESGPCTAYVELVRNCGVTRARNLGAELARSDLLLFLDDDAVPEADFVEAHRRAHDDEDVVAVRGRVFPRTDTFYNRLQRWYDLGEESLPYLLNIEGNTSIDREAFRAVSGFDERLDGRAGHEGVDLTYRLVRAGYDHDQIRYSPDPVVYHDYANSPVEYVRKQIVSRRHRNRLTERRPELDEFARTYSLPEEAGWGKSSFDHVVHLALDGFIRVGCRVQSLRKRFSDG